MHWSYPAPCRVRPKWCDRKRQHRGLAPAVGALRSPFDCCLFMLYLLWTWDRRRYERLALAKSHLHPGRRLFISPTSRCTHSGTTWPFADPLPSFSGLSFPSSLADVLNHVAEMISQLLVFNEVDHLDAPIGIMSRVIHIIVFHFLLRHGKLFSQG